MFGLGFFEILMILVGILIFVHPQDLPTFVYRVGKIYGQIKESYNKFYREINLIKNQMDEIAEKQNDLIHKNKNNEIKNPLENEDKKHSTSTNSPSQSDIPIKTTAFNSMKLNDKIKTSSKITKFKTQAKSSNKKTGKTFPKEIKQRLTTKVKLKNTSTQKSKRNKKVKNKT